MIIRMNYRLLQELDLLKYIIIITTLLLLHLYAGYLQLCIWNKLFLEYIVLQLFSIYNLCYM